MTNDAKPLRAAVVGLGNIGMGYDYEVTGDDRILTHAHAFAAHPGFDLVGAVDTDAGARRRFSDKYQKPAYATVAQLHSQQHPDVLALAVPTDMHAQAFHEIVDHSPRAILCEKPLAHSVREGTRMLAEAGRRGTTVMVNYMRRCEPGTIALGQAIAAGAIGELRKGVVWYSKGMANNGSHFIDLMRMLLGEAGGITVLAKGGVWNGDDVEPDVRILFGQTPIYFLAASHGDFGFNCFELLGSKAAVRYIDGGLRIELRKTTDDQALEGTSSIMKGDMQRYQWHVCDALHRHLAGQGPLSSDGANALESLRIVELIAERIAAPESR